MSRRYALALTTAALALTTAACDTGAEPSAPAADETPAAPALGGKADGVAAYGSCADACGQDVETERGICSCRPDRLIQCADFVEQCGAGTAWHAEWMSHSEAPDDVLRLPGEFEPVQTVLLFAYHHPDQLLVDLVAASHREAHVIVYVDSEGSREVVAELLADADLHGAAELIVRPPTSDPRVTFMPGYKWWDEWHRHREAGDTWLRDASAFWEDWHSPRQFGPRVVATVDGGRRVIDPYVVDLDPYYDGDHGGAAMWGARVGTRIPSPGVATDWAASQGLPVHRTPLRAEGGDVLSDGAGHCLVGRVDAEDPETAAAFRATFGCHTLIRVPVVHRGEAIDTHVTITGPREAIVARYHNPTNATWFDFQGNPAEPGTSGTNDIWVWNRKLDDAATRLEAAGFVVRRVTMPRPALKELALKRRTRSYTNAVAVNDVVLVPVWSDDVRFEAEALTVFQDAYPDRTIVPVEAAEAHSSLGYGLHTYVMTVPAGSTATLRWSGERGTAFTGDPCPDDAGCDFVANGAGFCHTFASPHEDDVDLGFCSVTCEGYCVDNRSAGATFCAATGDGQGGTCVAKAAPVNADCSAIPGTAARELPRWVGSSGAATATATVCVPEGF